MPRSCEEIRKILDEFRNDLKAFNFRMSNFSELYRLSSDNTKPEVQAQAMNVLSSVSSAILQQDDSNMKSLGDITNGTD